MLTAYHQLLAHRGVPQLAAVALLTRLGTPVLSVALLLAVHDKLGSYAVAGLVLSSHALSLAICAPVGGRLAGRPDPRRVLLAFLAAHTTAYALLLLALTSHGSAPEVVASAALLGASTPPASAVIRGAWPSLVRPSSLAAAYALDSATNELMFVFGPVLVSVLILAMSACSIVFVAGAAVLVGTLLLISSRAIARASDAPASPATSAGTTSAKLARLMGPLTRRPTLVLLLLAGLDTFTLGCLRIATVASATTFGTTSLAGVLASLLSAGTVAGGLAYGARSWILTAWRLLAVLSAVNSVMLLADAFAPGFLALAVLITITGLLSGPRETLQLSLLGGHAPARQRAEVFAWLNTFMWSGYGLGTVVAGRLTGPGHDGTTAFEAAAVIALLGAGVAIWLYRPVTPPPAATRAQVPSSRPETRHVISPLADSRPIDTRRNSQRITDSAD